MAYLSGFSQNWRRLAVGQLKNRYERCCVRTFPFKFKSVAVRARVNALVLCRAIGNLVAEAARKCGGNWQPGKVALPNHESVAERELFND